MKTYCILFLCWISTYVFSEEFPYKIQAKQTSYNGNQIILEGDVRITHPLGIIQAGNAKLTLLQNGDETTVQQMTCKGNVHIQMNENQALFCEYITLDLISKKGLFSSYTSPVMYQEQKKDRKPFVIYCKEGDFSFHTDPSFPPFSLATLSAKSTVSIAIDTDLIIKADEAVLTQNHSQQAIEIMSNSKLCHMTYLGHQVLAEKIYYDIQTYELSLLDPKGELDMTMFFPMDTPLFFQSQVLTLDLNHSHLLLQKDIYIHSPSLGYFTVDQSLLLCQNEVFGKKVLDHMIAKGQSHLVAKDPKTDLDHSLDCNGKLIFQRDDLSFAAYASQGLVTYQSPDFILKAKETRLQYNLVDLNLTPTYLIAKNEVEIHSYTSNIQPFTACSDLFSYHTKTHTATLSALPSKKVLFYQKPCDLKLSADKICLHKEAPKKITAQGYGNVRFDFTLEEEHQINQLIPNL